MRTTNLFSSPTKVRRTGAVIHLVALMLPIFIAFIAFAVDYGVINLAKHQLQNAADAGADAAIRTLARQRALG